MTTSPSRYTVHPFEQAVKTWLHSHTVQFSMHSFFHLPSFPSISATFSFILPLLLLCQAAQADDLKRVVFTRYAMKTEYSGSATVAEYKKTMAGLGFIEGQNIEYIDIVTHSADRNSVVEILEATDTYMESADIFITSGWTSLYVRSKLAATSLPQLFTPALKATALNMLPSVQEEPGTNLSGVYLMYPPEKILRLTHLILPDIRNYAYVYDSRIPADILFKAAYGKLRGQQLHGLKLHFIDLSSEPEKVLKELKVKKIEAYGGVIGVLKNRVLLSQSGLPVITSLLLDLDEKALADFIRDTNIVAGLFNSFGYCGAQAAEMTADIFAGKNTIEKTIPRPARQTAFANLAAAERLQIHIPFRALEGVDIVIR
jgi:putative ABC transport system substrate-binding protein